MATIMSEPSFKRKYDNDDQKKKNVCQIEKNYNIEFKDNSILSNKIKKNNKIKCLNKLTTQVVRLGQPHRKQIEKYKDDQSIPNNSNVEG